MTGLGEPFEGWEEVREGPVTVYRLSDPATGVLTRVVEQHYAGRGWAWEYVCRWLTPTGRTRTTSTPGGGWRHWELIGSDADPRVARACVEAFAADVTAEVLGA